MGGYRFILDKHYEENIKITIGAAGVGQQEITNENNPMFRSGCRCDVWASLGGGRELYILSCPPLNIQLLYSIASVFNISLHMWW